jgi:hypothetical protein
MYCYQAQLYVFKLRNQHRFVLHNYEPRYIILSKQSKLVEVRQLQDMTECEIHNYEEMFNNGFKPIKCIF